MLRAAPEVVYKAILDPTLPGEMQTTIALKRVSCGCDIQIVQERVPDAIPVKMCHLGRQDSLRLLALLVEAGT